MSEELAVVDSQEALAILQAAGVSLHTAAEEVNKISIKGKVWRYKVDGEFSTIQKEEEGELVNATMVTAVILGAAPTRAYALFEGGFSDGEAKAPICFSNNSKTPDSSVAEPLSTNCETCEKRVVGSAHSEDGRAVRACKESRLTAVVLKEAAKHTPLQLRLAVGSLWQAKEHSAVEEANGWYAFDAYLSMLQKKGIAHPCLVETRMKFGSGSGVTILFKMAGHLAKEHLVKIAQIAGSDEVKKLLGTTKASDQPAKTTAIESKPEVPKQVATTVVPAVEQAKQAEKPVKAAKPKAEPAPVVEAPASLDDQLRDW